MYKETVCSLSSLWQISTRGKNISLPFLSSTSLFTLLKPQMCLLTSFTHFFALHFSLLLWRNLLSLFYLDHRCEPAVLDYSGSQEVGSELCQSLGALPLPPGPERTSHPVEDGSLTPYGGDPALTQERAAGVGVGVMITCISWLALICPLGFGQCLPSARALTHAAQASSSHRNWLSSTHSQNSKDLQH